jgi:hypothetical protein
LNWWRDERRLFPILSAVSLFASSPLCRQSTAAVERSFETHEQEEEEEEEADRQMSNADLTAPLAFFTVSV